MRKEIHLKSSLPTLTKKISTLDLAMYGAATWDFHKIHLDSQYAKSAGLRTAVVDGQMFGGLLAKLIEKWSRREGRIRKFNIRYKTAVYAGDKLKLGGRVKSMRKVKNSYMYDCELWIKNQRNLDVVTDCLVTVELKDPKELRTNLI